MALCAVPASGLALAQSPPPETGDITLVNWDRQMVERKKDGDFVARPVFSRRTDVLFYSIRHPDTGEWLTATYRVQGGEKKLSEGWEYTFEYPALRRTARPPPGTGISPGAGRAPHRRRRPPRLPRSDTRPPAQGACGTRCWAPWTRTAGLRAAARWVIQGVHGTLCGVVEGVTQTDIH